MALAVHSYGSGNSLGFWWAVVSLISEKAARDDGGGELVAPARGSGGLGPIGADLGADPSSPPSGMKACGCTIPALKSEADGQIWWPRDGSGTLALGREAARRSSGLEVDPPLRSDAGGRIWQPWEGTAPTLGRIRRPYP
uniref:Uncharacterized protein n=1 Tax=Oryza barthii TaxID=65489 RepID=A0A0D3HKG1_9ORYZ